MTWICKECGEYYGYRQKGVTTNHLGKCGWCEEVKVVCSSRDYGLNGEEKTMNYEIGRWYPWFGGEQPVPDGTRVELLFSDGSGAEDENASANSWQVGYIHPVAFRVMEYPRRTVTIGGREVPAPMQEKPREGERYWRTVSDEGIDSSIWDNDETDRSRFDFGIWSRAEEAQSVLNAIRAALRGEGE